MANCEKLKALIEERGLKQRFIAQRIGVSDKKMHELLNGGRWRLDEVVAVCNVLNLNKKQREEIFFGQEVGV
jgi:DNA-binding XRE family transcriptional regulator